MTDRTWRAPFLPSTTAPSREGSFLERIERINVPAHERKAQVDTQDTDRSKAPTNPAARDVSSNHLSLPKPEVQGSSMTTKTTPLSPEMAYIRHLGVQEFRRGRPLIIVNQSSPRDPATINKKPTTGFDYLSFLEQNKGQNTQYIDLKSAYAEKSISLSVFYGKDNLSNLSFPVSNLAKHDEDGEILGSILQINSPGALRADEAEGIGLMAACMSANYVPGASLAEAQTLLKSLPSEVREESLRHALVFSCYLDNSPLPYRLLELGANPNVTSKSDGSMPLEIAIDEENLSLAQLLLAHGASPDIELTSGNTCRDLPEEYGLPAFAELLKGVPRPSE